MDEQTRDWLNYVIADRLHCMSNLPSGAAGIVHAQNVLNRSASKKCCYYCGKTGHRQFHLFYPPVLDDPYVCEECDSSD